MRTAIALCASALAVVLTSSSIFAAPTNLLTNGSFDKAASAKINKAGIIPITTRSNKNALPGWTILGPIDLVSSRLWQQPTGASYSVDLIGTPGIGGIQQTVHDTLDDHTYELSFDLSLNPSLSPFKETGTTKLLKVDILGGEGEVLATRVYSLTNGTRTLKNMQWATDSNFAGEEEGPLTFQGTGGDIIVRFTSMAPGALPRRAKASTVYCGPVIGNASLFDLGGGTPTPEPASLGILGVGASALILKRRRGR
jgi:hypothetical protein